MVLRYDEHRVGGDRLVFGDAAVVDGAVDADRGVSGLLNRLGDTQPALAARRGLDGDVVHPAQPPRKAGAARRVDKRQVGSLTHRSSPVEA